MIQKSIKIPVNEDILSAKKKQGFLNRDYFNQRNIVCLNIMSSPGSGKTSLLELTARHIKEKISVIEGDLQTQRDAIRMRAAGVDALQITTGQGCHLDAFMIRDALEKMNFTEGQILFIENVGNLVCPASHDLGSHANVVLLSVPEGDDKIAKYPIMFQKADLLILTKTDLEPYISFEKTRVYEDFRRVNPHSGVIEMSLLTGNGGLEIWLEYLNSLKKEILENNIKRRSGDVSGGPV